MTEQELLDFIAAHPWKFAKSMPHIPHEYVVRENCRDDEEFVRFVNHMRKVGYLAKWGKHKPKHYIDIDGHTYWTMGNPIWETTIINREVLGTSNLIVME